MDAPFTMRHPERVLDTDELLARLKARGVKNVEIARALGIADSRVPEIKQKTRSLKLEEAVKLVRVFGLEQDAAARPLPAPVLRLVVRYVAQELGARPHNGQLEELTQDVRAFAAFVADRREGQPSVEASEAFFEALRLRRPETEEEGQPGTDPEQTH